MKKQEMKKNKSNSNQKTDSNVIGVKTKKEIATGRDDTQLVSVVSTEKSLRLMESNNGLIFVFTKSSTKKGIQNYMEKKLGAKVDNVNTSIIKGNKKAFVYFSKETPAIDVATKLGIL